MDIKELEARLILHNLPKIGSRRFQQLIEFFGSAKNALASQKQWLKAGLPSVCQSLTINYSMSEVELTNKWLEQENHHIIFWDSVNYPALLKEIVGSPPILFIKGDPTILEKPQLAIVGSRHASKPGLDIAFQFAKSLAGAGFVINSGLALGIDGASHAGALAGHGLTVGVLGCGLQQIYPASHKKLAEDLVAQGGALVSEFPLQTAPHAANFPRRNRIISGLSLGVLVVEATLSSGSLITAKLAAEQGREVFAIPGSIHHPAAKGCHQLIREGATLVETVDHILEALQGWRNVNNPQASLTFNKPIIVADNNPLLALLHAAPQTSEALSVGLNIPFEQILINLTELELEGKVSCEAGIWYAC